MSNSGGITSKEGRILSKRLAKMNEKMCVILHYWKIRCAERNTLMGKQKRLLRLTSKFESLEKNLQKSFGRYLILHPDGGKYKAKEPLYPLFATRKEIFRMRGYFKQDLLGLKRASKGKEYVQVTRSEKAKLRRMFKKYSPILLDYEVGG